MRNLLRSDFIRLIPENAFRAGILIMIGYGICICWMLHYSMQLNDTVISIDSAFISAYGFQGILAIPGLILAVVCSLFTGTEYSDGTLRNKLICGHSRWCIYLSNFITCAAAGILINLFYMLMIFILGVPMFDEFQMEAGTIVFVFFTGLLTMISYAACFTMVTMLSQSKTAAAVINILAVVIFMFLCSYLVALIAQPEYYSAIEMVNGREVSTMVPNPHYLQEGARKAAQFVTDLLPSGQSLQLSSNSAVHLKLLPAFSGILICATNIFGILLFRKKDIK